MPVLDTTAANRAPQDNLGLALLRAAAQEDDAYREDCCDICHSADIEQVWREGDSWMCGHCGAEGIHLTAVSHLADALKCFDEPDLKIEIHDLAAVIEHAALLYLQLAELKETLAAERAQSRKRAELFIPTRKAPVYEISTPLEAA